MSSARTNGCRYVKQGRTILQPHHLLDELNNILEADKATEIKESAFGLMLGNCQVFTFFRLVSSSSPF